MNKDCCDDHEDFCTELYGAEEVLKCRTTTIAPPLTTTTISPPKTTPTFPNTSIAPTTTTVYWSDMSWVFLRN